MPHRADFTSSKIYSVSLKNAIVKIKVGVIVAIN